MLTDNFVCFIVQISGATENICGSRIFPPGGTFENASDNV
jgi:hypothetical protein